MSSIDTRVVEMKFNNGDFERGVKSSLTSLQALQNGLKLDGATKGLEGVNAAAHRLSLAGIAQGVDSIASKFGVLSIAGITALTNIANRAVDAGIALYKSLTITPITDGLKEYETNLNSIQTILANTSKDNTNLKQVNDALQELNLYSDKTIYNFAEMARNIGTFTAAGVKLDVSVSAIKGIANLAAVSGSSALQASSAMYQLSQAIATGTVKLIDWNSVSTAGMGGAVFQDALKETARVHGIAIDAIIKKEGSFRDSLQKGWLTSSILTETLSKFTGDLSAKQLKTMGYTDKQIVGIMKMAKTAQDAATKVKTMSQLIGTLQEAAGSGWAQTWQTIFGDFEEARTLFTNVNNVIGGMLIASGEARNQVLGDWKALGGRTALIDGISNAFEALISFIKPIGRAFREIFPATTGKQLYEFSVAVRNFTEGLKIGGDAAGKIQRTFAGFFAVIHIGTTIVTEGIKLLLRLFSVVGQGSGSFLNTTASIGDFLVKVDTALTQGGTLSKVFTKIGDALSVPIRLIKSFGSAIGSIFSGVDTGGISSAIGNLLVSFSSLGDYGKAIGEVWKATGSVLSSVWQNIVNFASKIAGASGTIGQSISELLKGLNFGDILGTINTGLLGGVVVMLRNLIGGGGAGGILKNIGDSFQTLTGTLKTMQNSLRAKTLLSIAAAIGILAVSVNILSKIDKAGLENAMTALTVMFTELFASMAIFEKTAGVAGFAKMAVASAALIGLAIAVDILTISVKSLSGLDWNGLAKGLTGVTVLLGLMVGVVKILAKGSKTFIMSATSLVILAAAVKLLASAVTDLSGLSWEALQKGLVGVGTLLGSLALFTRMTSANKAGVLGGAGLILLAAGIKILASAVQDFANTSWEGIQKGLVSIGAILASFALFSKTVGNPVSLVASGAALILIGVAMSSLAESIGTFGNMSWDAIGKGLLTMATALLTIGVALALLPPTSLLSAAAILVVASSLSMVADAMKSMGGMSWEEIAKGLTVLAASLLIISVAMFSMEAALPGAAALLVVAGALTILAPVLLAFGAMSWEAIGKGLVMLAGTFLIFGVAGLLLTPVIPTLIGLGLAVTLLGVGMLAAGAGVLAFSIGLTALSVAGAAGALAIVAIVSGLIGLIPLVMKEIGLGLVAFATVIANAGPAITNAITVVLMALITAIGTLTPKIVTTLANLIVMLLVTLANAVPKMVTSGMKIIVGILTGIRNNIDKTTALGLQIIAKFIDGISKGLPSVINSGVKLVISFVNSLASAIRSNSPAMGQAGANLALAIIQGMASGMASGVGTIVNAAKNVALSALNAAKAVLGVHSPSTEFIKVGKYVIDGFVKGLEGNRADVVNAFNNLKALLKDAMTSSKDDVDKATAKLDKLSHAHKKNSQAIKEATAALAQAKKEHKETSAAYSLLTKHLTDERDKLAKLADSYDVVTEKLKNAQSQLEDAVKTRDDYNASVKNQYSALPALDKSTQLTDYIDTLKQQIDDTKTFAFAIQRLRDLGLNDVMYKELLAKGVDSLPFVKQLLDAGKAGVDNINNLDKSLVDAATGLGSTASSTLYQAAVDSAAGLVEGLKKQQAAIEKQMEKIADAMVNAIKKKLGIKSPSKEFAQVGMFSAQGLVKGFGDASAIVEKSAENVGLNAILALRKSISGLSELVDTNVNLTPTITPVLDLTGVKKDSNLINSMLAGKPITIDAAYVSANSASIGYNSNKAAADAQAVSTSSSPDITFIQNNNSPKALSEAEIYRQTNNQLSKVKGATTP